MRVAVLASGRGSNLQALLDAQEAGRLAPAEVVAVVSNNPGAGALARAERAGVPALCVDHRGHRDHRGHGGRDGRDEFERALLAALAPHAIDAVALAGFMRILGATFLGAFPGRVVNTHPSLLPAFPGLSAPAQALAHGVRVSGCTVHFVDAGVDTGPIIAQAAVPVEDDDDAASLHLRIQAEEHRLLPEVMRMLAAGELLCEGRRVYHRPSLPR